MDERDDLFEDWPGEGPDEEADDEDDEDGDEGEPFDVRTAVMTKNDMVALLSLKTSATGGIIVRVDPRQPLPAAQSYEDALAATNWFNRSLATSRRNGWRVLYDGEPLFG